MNENPSNDPLKITDQIRIAIDTEQKVEIYISGVIFTTLGLAVNFTTAQSCFISNLFLSLGLLLLLISGLLAVFALSSIANRYWTIADMHGWQDGLQIFKNLSSQNPNLIVYREGKEEAVSDTIKFYEQQSQKSADQSILLRVYIKYSRIIRNIIFMFGVIFISLSKLWPIIVQMAHG